MIALTERYRPRRIRDFAGLTRAKAIMGKLVASPYASAWLFSGDKMSPAAQVAFLSLLDATGFPDNAIFIFTRNEHESWYVELKAKIELYREYR